MLQVALYAMLSAPIGPAPQGANPYDPQQFVVEGLVSLPDDTQVTWPAFWDGQEWQFRYQPVVPGQYEVVFRAAEQELGTLAFETTAPEGHGPLSADGYGFRHADGRPFVALGLNLGWSAGQGTDDYDAWFTALEGAGGTFARVWATHFTDQNPWWPDLDRMDEGAARNLDEILDHAEEHGISVLLVLYQHSQLDALAWTSWGSNPYNAANGGPCATSACFFTDPAALAHQDAWLRYAVARWGGHPALAGWEVMNEGDAVRGVDSATATAWAQARAADLRALDPNHMVTWSTSTVPDPERPEDWSGADFSQIHAYVGGDALAVSDAVHTLASAPAPTLVGEWGVDWFGSGDADDTEGRFWHEANWAALASGSAGNALTWWWDEHIAPDDLWWRLSGAASILAPLDLPSMGPAEATVSDPGLIVLARASDTQALVWLKGSAPEGTTLAVPALPRAQVQVFDTTSGAVLTEGRVCDEPFLLPAVQEDVAAVWTDASEACDRACGCATGKGPAPVSLLGLLALFVRRQRVSAPVGTQGPHRALPAGHSGFRVP